MKDIGGLIWDLASEIPFQESNEIRISMKKAIFSLLDWKQIAEQRIKL